MPTTELFLTVRELRERLREVIEAAKEGRTVIVGAHRKPEVAITRVDLGTGEAVPAGLLNAMLADVAVAEAHAELCGPYARHLSRGDVWQPGDGFGQVLAWLWETGRKERAAMLVTDLLAEGRAHNPFAPEPRLAFSDLLFGIRMCLPSSLVKEERDEIVEFLRDRVPGYYGGDPEGA